MIKDGFPFNRTNPPPNRQPCQVVWRHYTGRRYGAAAKNWNTASTTGIHLAQGYLLGKPAAQPLTGHKLMIEL